MPVIPQMKASSQLRTGGASISPSAAGAVGNALQGLGNTAAAIGFNAMDKKKQADDAAFVTETTNRILREETEKQADIETRGVDVDFNEIKASYDERLNNALENAPSEEAASAVRNQADTFYSRKFFPQYSQHQSKLNVNKRVNSVSNALDNIQSEVMTGRTSVTEALARSESAITGLAETSAGVVNIDQLRQGNNNAIVANSMSGRIDKGEARSVVKEIESGKWDKLAETNVLSKVLSAAKTDIKQREAKFRAEYASGLDDYVAFLSSGGEDDALAAKYSPERVASIYGEKGAKLNETIADAREFGRTVEEIKTASPDELLSLIDKNKPVIKEDKFIKRTPETENQKEVLTQTGDKTPEGRDVYVNQYGEFVTERTITIGMDGGFVNIPTVYNGKFLSEDEAIKKAIDANMTDPVTGRKLEFFDNVDSAVKSAEKRSSNIPVSRKKPTSKNFRRESKQFTNLVKAINQRNEAIAKDPASYTIENSPIADKEFKALSDAISNGDYELASSIAKSYSATQKGIQGELGIPSNSVALLPKQFASQIAKQMNDMSQGGENAVNTVNTMKTVFGDNWNTVLKQLSANKDIGESAQIIAMTPEGPEQVTVAEAMVIPQKELEGFIGSDSAKEIKEESFDTLDDLRETLRVGYGDSGVKSANSVQRAVEKTAMKLMVDGKASSTGDALDMAKEIIFGDVEIMDTYRVPKVENPSLVNLGVAAMKTRILDGRVPVLAPPSDTVLNEEDAREVYLKQLSITPITTLDGTGVAFVDSMNNILKDADGVPIEVPWSELKNVGEEEWPDRL